ncbi:helix-turn-helix transcriptional regulator [uncultured Microbulbifer sp.]|uniref:helix-turn-helix domain-containing protein n=1 Tax=uncultured Microbulbifer sp. TaxID=348147 RepID=UPI002621F164|nr:helix-turn-helix transcriptional regulator [uncultured Microbulbifer sp.]
MNAQLMDSAGKRLRKVREAVGLTQADFATKLNIKVHQVKNIEYGTSRIQEEVFAEIGRLMPELLPWVVYGGKVSLEQLEQSKSDFCKLLVVRIGIGLVTDATFLEMQDGD